MKHSELREIKYWDSCGINGDEPLLFIRISKLSNDHLFKIKDHLNLHNSISEFISNEIQYRKDNNIFIEDRGYYRPEFKLNR